MVGNFTIYERVKYEHLPFPSREELLEYLPENSKETLDEVEELSSQIRDLEDQLDRLKDKIYDLYDEV